MFPPAKSARLDTRSAIRRSAFGSFLIQEKFALRGQGGCIIDPMGCQRCAELFKLAEEAIEVHAEVHAQLAIAELERSRVKARRLRNLARTTGQTRQWATAAYRTHASSHPPAAKARRAGPA